MSSSLTSSSTAGKDDSLTPCVPERTSWRACMAANDYQPDRDLRNCNETRESYYGCLNAWRKQNPQPTNDQRQRVGVLHSLCVGINDKLRTCMEIYMFETHRCQKEMQELRECAGKVDKDVRSATLDMEKDLKKKWEKEQAELAGTAMAPGQTPAQAAIWAELWEKKPSWAQEGKVNGPRI